MAAAPSTDKNYYDFKGKGMSVLQKTIYAKKKASKLCVATSKRRAGGMSALAYEESLNPFEKIGMMVCGNSGKPGGYVNGYNYNAKNQYGKVLVHPYYGTQEEDLVSNCIMSAPSKKEKFKELFMVGNTFRWGLKNNDATPHTIQGVNYITTEDANDYGEAWATEPQDMWQKQCFQTCYDDAGAPGLYVEKRYNKARTYKATLVFVSGPNGKAAKGDTSSTKRTKNKKAAKNFTFFKECAKAAIRAGIDAMADKGVTVAFVGLVSAGLYNPYGYRYTGGFEDMVNEILKEQVGPNDEMRSQYFTKVIIANIPPWERNNQPYYTSWKAAKVNKYSDRNDAIILRAARQWLEGKSTNRHPSVKLDIHTEKGSIKVTVYPHGTAERQYPFQEGSGGKVRKITLNKKREQAKTDLETRLKEGVLWDVPKWDAFVKKFNEKSEVQLKDEGGILQKYVCDATTLEFSQDEIEKCAEFKQHIINDRLGPTHALPHEWVVNFDPITGIEFKNNSIANYRTYRLQFVAMLSEIDVLLSTPLTLCIVKPK